MTAWHVSWYQVDTERSSDWVSVINATVAVLQQQLALHPDTGLLADFLVYDHSQKRYKPPKGRILERDSDGDFGYNACRFVEGPDWQQMLQRYLLYKVLWQPMPSSTHHSTVHVPRVCVMLPRVGVGRQPGMHDVILDGDKTT